MISTSEGRYGYIPAASIVALIFIGVIFLIGLIGRCLALNQSTLHSAQSSDLMIYTPPPPKVHPSQQKPRSSTDLQYDPTDIPITPTPIQRGPKNL